jgi:hypothetical protein
MDMGDRGRVAKDKSSSGRRGGVKHYGNPEGAT